MIPTARERKALRSILFGDMHYLGDLIGAGEQTRQAMLEKGWIELLPHPVTGDTRVRITEAGKAAYHTPVSYTHLTLPTNREV